MGWKLSMRWNGFIDEQAGRLFDLPAGNFQLPRFFERTVKGRIKFPCKRICRLGKSRGNGIDRQSMCNFPEISTNPAASSKLLDLLVICRAYTAATSM
ncbi:MAG TPA: hypothetical protein VN653_00065 [Anaerolineales bacterium]|nr:hypothetical protein [Anaerolineales bacterium]